MALAIAERISAAAKLDVIFGPLDRARLTSAGATPPEAAHHAPGSENARTWLDEHGRPSDLIILAGQGNPFSEIQRLAGDGLSAVVVARHQESQWQWYSSEGALGVIAPRG